MKAKIKTRKRKIRVLHTSSKGVIALGRITSLKKNRDYNFYVIGVNAGKNNFKLPVVDEQHVVPFANDINYIKTLKKIALERKADVIVPTSDYEIEHISKHKDDFEKLGIACVCSKHETIQLAGNKGDMLKHLKKNKIPTPYFETPNSPLQLKKSAKRLGYPNNQLVFKPSRTGGGNRGVYFIKKNFSDKLMEQKGVPYITMDGLLEQLEYMKSFPDCVIMEYLPGEEYSVDCLSEKGDPIYIIPRVRVVPLPGYSQEAFIKKNEDVKRYVSRISRAFGFDSNFNVQLKYSSTGKPRIYEINPRVSGTVVANTGAGVNLFLFGILKALKIDYPKKLKPNSVNMLRFWTEYYF